MKQNILNSFTTVLLLNLISLTSCQKPEETKNKIIIGETVTVPSKHLNKEMIIDVFLPEGYASSTEKYPVLFSCHCNFLHVSGICADLELKNYTPGIIVALVRNYNSEYLMPEKIEGYADSGCADNFISFYKDELIPFIDSHFRTQPFRIFYSGGFGGGFCIYTFLTQPGVFNAYIAASPSINYEGGSNFIENNFKSYISKNNYEKKFLYIGIDNDTMLLPVVEKFMGDFKNANLKGLNWEYHPFLDEEHGSIANRVIYHGLKYIFSEWCNIPPSITEKGVSAIIDYIKNLNENYEYVIGISSFAIWSTAMTFEQKNELIDAIELLKYYLEYSPAAHMFWRKLGKLYEKNDQFELAKNSFETAYQKAVENSSPYLAIFTEDINRIKQKLSVR